MEKEMSEFDEDGIPAVQEKTPEELEQERKDAEFLERLNSMSNEDLGKLLPNNSLKQLLITFNKGWATASDINTARQFLKDNNIGIVATRENAAGQLKEKLKQRAEAAQTPGAGHHSLTELDDVNIDDFLQRH
ncbi:DNA maturase [Pectobacterium phage MA14]|nr:DNA maturase [Pectobacterium phage MA14]